MIRWLPILLILLAPVAMADDDWYWRNGSGDIAACVGTDRDLISSVGGSAQGYDLPHGSATDNWNDSTNFAGTFRSGEWTCNVFFDTTSGAGSPNRATIKVDRVDSSCNVQENIFTHETPNLTKGGRDNLNCDIFIKAVTFGAGEGILITIWESNNGGQTTTLDYNGTVGRHTKLRLPSAGATPTPTATPVTTATPTATPTAPDPTFTPTATPIPTATPVATPTTRIFLIQ